MRASPAGPSGVLAGVILAEVTRPVSGSRQRWALNQSFLTAVDFVATSCFRVESRDHSVLGDAACQAPGPVLISWLDVLGGDESEYADGVSLF